MRKKNLFLSGCDSNHSEKPAGAKSSNPQVVKAATSNGCSLFSSSHEALKARVCVTSRELFERGGALPLGTKPRHDLIGLGHRMNDHCIEKTATEKEMQQLLDEAEKLGCQCQIIALDWFCYQAWKVCTGDDYALFYNAYGENDEAANIADAQLLGIPANETTRDSRLAPESYKPQNADEVQVLFYKYQTESGEVKYVIAFPHVLRKL